MSYLTRDELEALQSSGLHVITPYVIDDPRHEAMRLARLDRRVKWHGDDYTYIDATDELIRDDVIKWIAKIRKAATADKKRAAKTQRGLFDGE